MATGGGSIRAKLRGGMETTSNSNDLEAILADEGAQAAEEAFEDVIKHTGAVLVRDESQEDLDVGWQTESLQLLTPESSQSDTGVPAMMRLPELSDANKEHMRRHMQQVADELYGPATVLLRAGAGRRLRAQMRVHREKVLTVPLKSWFAPPHMHDLPAPPLTVAEVPPTHCAAVSCPYQKAMLKLRDAAICMDVPSP